MTADSLAARRSVREHLETHFEDYLVSVSAYLRQAYPELQLSGEVSEEIAATVIVRVSHSNTEPEELDKALCSSADELVRTRRPRLSQARFLEEMNGPLRSEFPRAVPSLRLIQTLSRAPAINGEGDSHAGSGLEAGSKLLLANPPTDLGASIGLGGVLTAEMEPAFISGPTHPDNEFSSVVPSLAKPPPVDRGGRSEAHDRDVPDDDLGDDGFESGTMQEDLVGETSRIEAKHVADADLFGADSGSVVADPNREEAARVQVLEPPSESSSNDAPSNEMTLVTGAIEPGGQDHALPVPEEAAESDHPASRDATDFGEHGQVGEGELASPELEGKTDEPNEGGALFAQDRFSSAPPTQESLVPRPYSAEVAGLDGGVAPRAENAVPVAVLPQTEASSAKTAVAQLVERESARDPAAIASAVGVNPVPVPGAGQPALEAPSVAVAPVAALSQAEPVARTRRKVAKRAKKATTKTKPSAKKAATTRHATPSKARGTAKNPAQSTKRKPPAVVASRTTKTAAPGASFVQDDLAVVAMIGFPSNPKRAARLCVTAMGEELGIGDDADVSPCVLQVTEALEALRSRWLETPPVPLDAHLQWQRVARQATLKAFLGTRK